MNYPARRAIRLVLALASIAQAGCRDLLSPDGDRKELDQNRDRWRSAGMTGYTYTLSRSCFCGPDVTQLSRIEVRGDSVVSVVAVSDGRVLDRRYFPTVEAMFTLIEDAIDQRAKLIRVVYDPVFGYPREIDYDGSEMIADDEISYRASSLVRAP